MKPYDDVYLSVDIEADGPIPGPYSMLSLAAAAFDIEKTCLGTFSVNLLPLPDAGMHPETRQFWDANPQAFAQTQIDRQPPAEAMAAYCAFIKGLRRRPVFVGYPASYDFMWHHWYIVRFTGEDPCGFQALDIKSYAAAVLRTSFRESTKRRYPKAWFAGAPDHDHVALNDAIGQGHLAINLLRQHLGLGASAGAP